MSIVLRVLILLASIIAKNGNSIPTLASRSNTVNDCSEVTQQDVKLSFLELAEKYGHKGEHYEVTTEDGYVLTVFRINGKKGKRTHETYPILLYHGLLDSADAWILRGNISLSVTLAERGHDVWLGNNRGNRYSRRNIYIDMEKDSDKYWNFTFNELGKYDLPATIDLVLNETGAKKLNGIGHSQGNTMFYVLLSTRPEYNEKVHLVTSLAPIAYVQHTPPPVSTLIKLLPVLYMLGRLANVNQVFAENSLVVKELKAFCSLPGIGYTVCALRLFFPLIGYDTEELGPCFFRIMLGHFFQPSSFKNYYHFSQVGLRKKFAHYDYGAIGNKIAYNSSTPPDYDLSKITTKCALLVGRNDHLSTLDDVAILREQLPNVVAFRIIPRPQCNHADFVEGQHMPQYLYPYIFDVLQKYGSISGAFT